MATTNSIKPLATSTNMATQYLRSKYLPNVTYTEPNNNYQVQAPDFFNPTYLRALQSLKAASAVRYNSPEHISTVAFNFSGNTSCWWMYIRLSLPNTGSVHALTIPLGSIVLVPDIAAARQAALFPTSAQVVSVVLI